MSTLFQIISCLLTSQIATIEAILSTLSIQTLDIKYPSRSWRGAAGIHDRTLFSWNGYECNVSDYTQCDGQIETTTDTLYTLDISNLTLTAEIPRKIDPLSISSQWKAYTLVDPIWSSKPTMINICKCTHSNRTPPQYHSTQEHPLQLIHPEMNTEQTGL